MAVCWSKERISIVGSIWQALRDEYTKPFLLTECERNIRSWNDIQNGFGIFWKQFLHFDGLSPTLQSLHSQSRDGNCDGHSEPSRVCSSRKILFGLRKKCFAPSKFSTQRCCHVFLLEMHQNVTGKSSGWLSTCSLNCACVFEFYLFLSIFLYLYFFSRWKYGAHRLQGVLWSFHHQVRVNTAFIGPAQFRGTRIPLLCMR